MINCQHCKNEKTVRICHDEKMSKYVCQKCHGTFRIDKAGNYINHRGEIIR